jgi:hypothetical protein
MEMQNINKHEIQTFACLSVHYNLKLLFVCQAFYGIVRQKHSSGGILRSFLSLLLDIEAASTVHLFSYKLSYWQILEVSLKYHCHPSKK